MPLCKHEGVDDVGCDARVAMSMPVDGDRHPVSNLWTSSQGPAVKEAHGLSSATMEGGRGMLLDGVGFAVCSPDKILFPRKLTILKR